MAYSPWWNVVLLAVAVAADGLYDDKDSDVVQLTTANFQKEVVKSDGIWIVEFYAPWCGHCKSLAPEYAKAAKALKGFVKVGAVNVDDERSLGQEFGVQGFPTIKVFGSDKKKPSDYNGARTADGIIDEAFKVARQAANARIGKKSSSSSGSSSSSSSGKGKGKKDSGSGGNDVITLNDDNFEELVLNSDEPWLVEFYAPWCGHCKNLAPEWAKAATALKGKLKLGAYDADSQKQYGGRYNIRGFPTIKFFPGGKKGDTDVVDYDGARNADGIVAWANERVVEELPPPEVHELTGDAVLKEACEQSPLCIIAVLPHILDCQSKCRKEHIASLKKLADKYKQKQWGWVWSEAGAHSNLEDAVGLGGFGYPAMAAASHKKNIFTVMKGSFSFDGINAFLRDLAAGRGSTEPIRGGKLPTLAKSEAWDGKDGKLPVEESDLNLDDIELDPLSKDEL
ncbi:Protein disulfide-isomerase A6 [Hypsibius exemplaris]|uniref:protein disulfide-isomerase n=1 Tax=Hypsibius exemplaris TaxID=2072580 RepID=A0A9X6RMH1_HYPEX|nr:Protein disulfide-isomerase A6 [Hypsibius exemplaris]